MLEGENTRRKFTLVLLIAALLLLTAGLTLAQETTPAAAVRYDGRAKANLPAPQKGAYETYQLMQTQDGAPLAARSLVSSPTSPIQLPAAAPKFAAESLAGTVECPNLLGNSQLDIVLFEDGFGTAEPWVFLDDIVYYIQGGSPGDPSGWAYDGFSLFFQDGDPDDLTPGIDAFGQGIQMPPDLTELSVAYQHMSIDGNPNDEVWGELWLLDDQWMLDFDNLDNLIGFWQFSESQLEWQLESVDATEEIVQALSGQKVALILYNWTDASPSDAPEAQKEWMFVDDIALYACSEPAAEPPKQVFLPSISKASESEPLCVPPTENPPDHYKANRGFAQTNAPCNSMLSEVDRADYYTYRPSESGPHILHLKELPKDSEWSAMIFVNSDQPEYAPGETDGDCRIDTPGAGDKKVKCDLKANQNYFIKVSVGSTPMLGPYEMEVDTP
jgi:hypothetical protein